MSKMEDNVAAMILGRAKVGEKKYGTTMDRNDLSLLEWLQHLQEELCDAAVYVEKLKQEVNYQEYELRGPCSAHDSESARYEESEIEERRMRHIGQNGNDGLHYDGDETGYGQFKACEDYMAESDKRKDELNYLANKSNWANKEEIQKKQQISDYPESNRTLYPGDIIVTYDEVQKEKR